MDITGEYRLAADRQRVWDALQDAKTLQACIPGCESLERVADGQVNAVIAAAVGPVKSRFKTTISLADLNPPESYTMSGEGKGGAAGFGRGAAKVRLLAEGGETVLTYDADLKVGGKLAQVGSRLVVGVARKFADQFFDAFAERVGTVADTAVPAADGASTGLRRFAGMPLALMLAGAVLTLVLWILFASA